MAKEINSRTDMPNLRNKYKDMVVPKKTIVKIVSKISLHNNSTG